MNALEITGLRKVFGGLEAISNLDLTVPKAPAASKLGDAIVTGEVVDATNNRPLAGAEVRLVGTVNTVRGHYDFQGRRFDILRDGTVRFTGLDDLDPTLDIRTQRVIQAVTAYVEPRLIEPTILYDYPIELSPFARVTDDDAEIVERFEFFIGGMELGNAFTELNDAAEQEHELRGRGLAGLGDDRVGRQLANGRHLPPEGKLLFVELVEEVDRP